MPTLPDMLAHLDKITQELDASLSRIKASLYGEENEESKVSASLPGSLGYLDRIIDRVGRLARQADAIDALVSGDNKSEPFGPDVEAGWEAMQRDVKKAWEAMQTKGDIPPTPARAQPGMESGFGAGRDWPDGFGTATTGTLRKRGDRE